MTYSFNTPSVSLAHAVERVELGLKTIGATWNPRVTTVTRYVDTGLTAPFWWIFPSITLSEPIGSEMQRIPFVITFRLVIGAGTEGYDGRTEALLYQWIPDVLTFFAAHRSLRITTNSPPIRFLDAGNVRISQTTPVGLFSGASFTGVEFQLATPFVISIPTAPGN